MKKLHDDYLFVGAEAEVDIAAGVVYIPDGGRTKRYKLHAVYRWLLHRAYEAGRANQLPYVPQR